MIGNSISNGHGYILFNYYQKDPCKNFLFLFSWSDFHTIGFWVFLMIITSSFTWLVWVAYQYFEKLAKVFKYSNTDIIFKTTSYSLFCHYFLLTYSLVYLASPVFSSLAVIIPVISFVLYFAISIFAENCKSHQSSLDMGLGKSKPWNLSSQETHLETMNEINA